MVKGLNSVLKRLRLGGTVIFLLVLAVLFSEIVALGMNALLFGADPWHIFLNTGLTTPIVSAPLILLCVSTIKHLEASRNRVRQVRDRALAESQAKSNFLANMSHELRTPLNAVLGFAQVIEQELIGPHAVPKYRDYARDIRVSGEHLLGIISDLLELTRLDRGTAKLDDQPLDLADSVDLAVKMVAARACQRGLRLVQSVPADLGALKADPRLLRQMLLNLLTNAIKFTPEGGRIEIAAKRARTGDLWLTVSDTGCGIAADQIAKVLEPFGQVEGVQARQHDGLGLGLPLVKSMIELHGGQMWLTSSPGEGTSVRLSFPADRLLPRPCSSQAVGKAG